MGLYRVSGVWKDNQGEITHYGFHKITTIDKKTIVSKVQKKSKQEAVTLLENEYNNGFTWLWNYNKAKWEIGKSIEVVEGENEKYLRSDPDNKLTNNLAHLIDYNWVF